MAFILTPKRIVFLPKKSIAQDALFLMYEIGFDYLIATGINDLTAFLYANTPLSLNSTVVAFPKMS